MGAVAADKALPTAAREINGADPLLTPSVVMQVKLANGVDEKIVPKPEKKRQYQPHRFDPVTNTGRWKYLGKLGEGSYGHCWKALDMHGVHTAPVALKVSKYQRMSAPCFMLHREAMYSMRYIHCIENRRYNKAKADLFVKYLEDHTSFASQTEQQDNRRELDFTATWKNAKIEEINACDDEIDYVVMEFCEGQSLRKVLRGRTLTIETSRQVVAECCSALEYLTELDPALVHRDFRPANLLWTGSKLKVLDFGLMLSFNPEMSRSLNAVNNVPVCAKNYWMPPEVHNGQTPQRNFGALKWSFDIFSLGSIVYEICTPRLATGSGEEVSSFYKTLINPRDPNLFEVQAFWRGIGVVEDMLTPMLHKREAARPKPSVVRDRMTEKTDLLVGSLFAGNCRIRLTEQKVCSFCGALKLIEGIKPNQQKQKLTDMCRWLNEGGPKAWLYAYRRIEELAREGESLVSELLVEMKQTIAIDTESAAEVVKEIEDSQKKVVDLLGTITDSRRTNTSCKSTSIPSSCSRASSSKASLHHVDPLVAARLKEFQEAHPISTFCKRASPKKCAGTRLPRTLTGPKMSCATPSRCAPATPPRTHVLRRLNSFRGTPVVLDFPLPDELGKRAVAATHGVAAKRVREETNVVGRKSRRVEREEGQREPCLGPADERKRKMAAGKALSVADRAKADKATQEARMKCAEEAKRMRIEEKRKAVEVALAERIKNAEAAKVERKAAAAAEVERKAAAAAEVERKAADAAEEERKAAVAAEEERKAAAAVEAERIATEAAEEVRRAAEAVEAERIAAEMAEGERKAAEAAEEERRAAEAAAEEKKAAEAAEEERKAAEAAEEAIKAAEVERKAAEGAEEEERKAAEAAEEERKAAEAAEEERKAAVAAEEERKAAQAAEEERKAAEAAEEERKAAEAAEEERKAAEAAEEERKAAEAAEEERKAAEAAEEERKAAEAAEEERKAVEAAEEERKAAEAAEEEERKAAEAAEEERKAAAAAEEERIAIEVAEEERKAAEEARKAAEAADGEKKVAEATEEARRAAEAAEEERKAAEGAEEERIAAEAAEEERIAAEAAADERRIAAIEAERKAAETAEEERKTAEAAQAERKAAEAAEVVSEERKTEKSSEKRLRTDAERVARTAEVAAAAELVARRKVSKAEEEKAKSLRDEARRKSDASLAKYRSEDAEYRPMKLARSGSKRLREDLGSLRSSRGGRSLRQRSSSSVCSAFFSMDDNGEDIDLDAVHKPKRLRSSDEECSDIVTSVQEECSGDWTLDRGWPSRDTLQSCMADADSIFASMKKEADRMARMI